MGQVEVLRFLKEHPDRWFTSFEIRERFGFAQSSITTVLRKLRKYGLVEYKEIRTPAVAYLYRAKM